MKRIITYYFLFLWSVQLFAQSKEIDSLFAVLKTEKEDTNKVKTLNALSRQTYLIGKYPLCDSFTGKALSLAKQLNYKKGMCRAYTNIGNSYWSQGNYPEAIKAQMNALKIDEGIGNKKGISTDYSNIGNIYWAQGKYPEALADYLKALKADEEIGGKIEIAEDYESIGIIYYEQGSYPEALSCQLKALKMEEGMGNKRGISHVYSIIGSIYGTQDNYTEALVNYLKALEIEKEIGNKERLGYSYNNIGTTYESQCNYTEALSYELKALKIEEEIGNKRGMGNAYRTIGTIYRDKGNYTEALSYQFKSLTIAEEIGNKEGMANDDANIGNVFTQTKKYKEARAYLDSGLTLSKSIGEKEMIRDSYNDLSMYDSATGDYKKALADYKMYVVYKDSLKNEENTKKIVSQQMQFDFDKKEQAAKDDQDKKDAIAATESKRQKIIIGCVVAIALAVGFIALIILRSLRITRKQKDIIEFQKSEVENKNLVIEQKNKDILDSITYAKRLQDAILPPLSLIEKYFPESFVLYKPKDIVAGDFYWMEREGDVILLAACDCTGHGVPGALVSVVCSNALNRAFKEFKIRKTGLLLDKVRELVLETFAASGGEVKDGMDISFCAINTKTKEIEWSGAYNPLWYIAPNLHPKEGNSMGIVEIKADKQPIGETDNPKPFTTHTINLEPPFGGQGGCGAIYLFTDGFADQFGGTKGKKFKYKQLKEKLMTISHKPMAEQKEELEREFVAWKGELEQTDDVCVIGIRI